MSRFFPLIHFLLLFILPPRTLIHQKNLTEREIMRMLSSGKKFIATFVVVLMPKLMMDGDISSSRVKGGNGKAGYFLKHFSHRITSQSIQTIFFVIHGDEKKRFEGATRNFIQNIMRTSISSSRFLSLPPSLFSPSISHLVFYSNLSYSHILLILLVLTYII